MRQFSGLKRLFVALVVFLSAPISWGLSADQKLLSLVPPGARIVAGMDSPPPKGQPGSFVLITHNNRLDLQDYLAVTGVDSSRVVRHAIFVASNDDVGQLDEHSLLMIGHFDQARIYKSAQEGGATANNYRGVAILEVPPFARERRDFSDVRWLAILDSDILLFGTISNVREELDRYLAGSTADPYLAAKLGQLRRDDETWCVMSVAAQNREIQQSLVGLDPALAKLVEDADTFQFGIRYHKQVEFEYEITKARVAGSGTVSGSLSQTPAAPQWGSWLLASPTARGDSNAVHGVIKIPVDRFSAWLREVSGPWSGGKP
jgi:hypothetical protein